MKQNWSILWSEFETHDILLQNAFSVHPLQFIAKSKAREAYDWGKSNLLVFKACFPWHFSALLISVLDLYLYSYEADLFSAFSFDSFGQGTVTWDYYSIWARDIFYSPPMLIFKKVEERWLENESAIEEGKR